MRQLITGLVSAALLAGCVSVGTEAPRSQLGDHVLQYSAASDVVTPALRNLEADTDYVVLIDRYPVVKKLSSMVGFSGSYGHIEVVRNGQAYGCRPPVCSEISLSELERTFAESGFEIRKVVVDGNSDAGVGWFRDNLEGKAYDLLYTNCTDAVVGMYAASGDVTRRIDPVMVGQTYSSNALLRQFLAEVGLPKPDRDSVFFPDQFEDIGSFAARGTFLR